MKTQVRSTLLALALSITATSAGLAGPVPEGSFKGTSGLAAGPNIMAFLVRRDPADPKAYYAILAEYQRRSGVPLPERTKLTVWVNRMFAYRLEEVGALRYAAKPLRVSSGGEITVDGTAAATLTLANSGTMDGATLSRDQESVLFDGRISSTWEGYVPGDYFGTKDSTGGDYFKKNVNMTLSPDKVADFFTPEIKGKFEVAEKAPGMFTFTPKSAGNQGEDKVLGRIGVFIDIVNWKPVFTTDELLLINPGDPKDVGFYYERH